CRTARTKPPPPEVPEAASAATPEVGDQTTEVVRKVLSGIARSKGRFGKTTVAAMLTGSKSQTMQRWKLNQLSTYGLLAAFKQPEVVQIIDNLIAAGWVTQDEVEPFRPVISVNAVGWEVMTGEREAACRWQVPTELLAKIRCAGADRVPPLATGQRKSPATDPATAQATEEKGPIDQGLLQRLREARNRWAAEAGLPPYHVLQNATIEELARAKPRSPNELLAIKGIGPAKVDRYGKRLLGIVGGPPSPARAGPSSTPRPASSKATDFPDQQPGSTVSPPDHFTVARRASEAVDHLPGPTVPLPDPSAGPVPSDAHQQSVHHQPDYYWTWRLLERGFTQMECALIRSLDESTVLEHALAAARDGHPVPLDAFLTLDLNETLAAVAGSARTDSIEALCEKLPDDIGAEHVRLYLLTRELKSNT
ncbi:MAG: HRDC domain-containing protein, partial [Planctomycetes bacterium]|nr:HRDC domain-containing protein [Planctomycetota bacterium]